MKKTMGIASSFAAMTLAGAGLYMVMSKDTKKQMSKAMNSAKEDVCKVANKAMNSK